MRMMQNELYLTQAAVAHFMQAAGQRVPTEIGIPSFAECMLRVKLCQEELDELREAMIAGDIVECADAIADLLYVTLGAAVALGIQIGPVFSEVHRSNMTKFIDGHRRDDGKWVKGPSYSPAQVAHILERQLATSKLTTANPEKN